MNESPIPLLSPEVGFKHERIPPPPMAYVTKDDFLAVSVYTTSSTTGLKLAYRFLDSAGHTHYGSESLDGASTTTLTTKIFPLTEGWLLGLTVSNLGGGLADQVCFVLAALQRSGQASTPPHTVLAQGYVSNLFSVDWPPVYVRGPATSSSSVPTWVSKSPDNPPETANAMNDEFDGASFNSALWTWQDQLTATATQSNSHLQMTCAGVAAYKHPCIFQALPSGDWSFGLKMSVIGPSAMQQYATAGLCLLETTQAKAVGWGWLVNTAGVHVPAGTVFDSLTNIAAYRIQANMVAASYWNPIYVMVARAGTTLTYSASPDGITWIPFVSEAQTTPFTAAPNKVGIMLATDNTDTLSVLSCDWFRRLS